MIDQVHFNFANSVSTNINIVNPIFKLAGHLISMNMQRLLDHKLVIFSNIRFHLVGNRVSHDLVKVFTSDCKGLNFFDSLVQEFTALVAQTGVVVDWADDSFGFRHDDAGAVKYFVEKSVADSY